MTIYDRIRALRISQKMSQTELAEKMGYKDGSMITKIESGKVDISQKKIVAFAKALSTTPSYLMGWTEEGAPDPSKLLSNGEWRLVTAYREADDGIKKSVRKLLDIDEPAEKDAASASVQTA